MKLGRGEAGSFRIELIRKGQSTLDSPPTMVRLDSSGRPHSLDSPAIEWEDGLRSWFIEGVQFDQHTWEEVVKRTIPAERAVKLTNIEQRRIAIKRIGFERMLNELNAKALEIWHGYALYRIELWDDVLLEDLSAVLTAKEQKDSGRFWRHYLPANFLHMRDSSAKQWYFLRVPPDVQNCQEAIAWTFNMRANQYDPETET